MAKRMWAILGAVLLALAFAFAAPSLAQTRCLGAPHTHHHLHVQRGCDLHGVSWRHHRHHQHRLLASAAAASPDVEGSLHCLAMANLRAREAGVPIAVLRVGFDRWLADCHRAATDSPRALRAAYAERIAYARHAMEVAPNWSILYPPVEVAHA